MGIKGDTGMVGPSSITHFEIKNELWCEKHVELQSLCFRVMKFLQENPEISSKVEVTRESMRSFLKAE